MKFGAWTNRILLKLIASVGGKNISSMLLHDIEVIEVENKIVFPSRDPKIDHLRKCQNSPNIFQFSHHFLERHHYLYVCKE